MNLLDLLAEDGHSLKRKTSKELAGSCPFCGGTDRFIVHPEKGKGGRYWCRRCDKKGDAIQFLRDTKG
ncbi:CHC2 zinc finger domain-containing protein, partial [Thermodesulfobacteriota bacterium]